jgi:hypothetical protein
VADVYQHYNQRLDILKPSTYYYYLLVVFYQLIFAVDLVINGTFCLLLNLLDKSFLFLLKISDYRIGKQEFCSNFWFCIVELRRLLLYGVCNGWFFLQYFVYHFACFCDISVLPCNFGCSVSHSIYWLIDNNFGIGLSHNFIYLMAFGSNEERDHPLRYKDNYRKKLFFYFSKCIKNITEHIFTTQVFFLHVMIEYLNGKLCTCMFFPLRSGMFKSVLNFIDSTLFSCII